MPYNTIYTADLSMPTGFVSAGGSVAGAIDAHGNVAHIPTAGTLRIEFLNDPWKDIVYVSGSDAKQNSQVTFRIPAGVDLSSGSSTAGYGPFLRAHPWSSGDARYAYYGAEVNVQRGLTIFRQDNNGTALELAATSLSWRNTAHVYDGTLKAEGSNPTTLTLTVYDVTAGAAVPAATLTATDSTALLQTPGLAGVTNTVVVVQPAGPTDYGGLSVAIADATAPLIGTIAEGVRGSATSNVIAVTPSGGVPGATSGNSTGYTVALYGTNRIVPTVGAPTRLDNTSAVSAALSSDGKSVIFTHNGLVQGDIWFYKATVLDAASGSTPVLAMSAPASPVATLNYLVVQVPRAALPTNPPAPAAPYAGGVCVMVAGNSFIGHLQNTDQQSAALATYLSANGYSNVHTAVLGFPGSAIGNDWGESSPVYSPGGGGPTGAGFAPYGMAGDDTSKNLLHNLEDRTRAFSAAYPGVPVIIEFFEITNAARENITTAAATADAADLVAMARSHGWKIVFNAPSLLLAGADATGSVSSFELVLWDAIRALANNVDVFAGYDEFFYQSFVNAATWHNTDPIHMDGNGGAGYTAQGTLMAKHIAYSLVPGLVAVTGVTITPSAATIPGNGTQQYAAQVNGSTGVSQSGTWANSLGTITAQGLATAAAPIVGQSQVGTVTFVPDADPSKIGSATFTIPAKEAGPVFSPASGATITQGGTFSLSDSDSAASIRYTLDGTIPTSASPLYSGPVALPNVGNATVKAIAQRAGETDSDVSTATYTVVAPPSPPLTEADIPAIVEQVIAGLMGAGFTSTALVIPGPFQLNAAAPAAPIAAGVGDDFAIGFYITVNAGRTRLPLVGKTVTMSVRNQNNQLLSPVGGVPCQITNAAQGEIVYPIQPGDTVAAGVLRLTATVADAVTGDGAQTYGPVTMPVIPR